MSDEVKVEGAEAPADTAEFDAAWAELDRAETTGQATAPPEEKARSGSQDADEFDSGDTDRQAPDAVTSQPERKKTDEALEHATPEQLREALAAERKARETAENTVRSNNARWSMQARELDALKARPQPAAKADAAPDPEQEAKDRAERHDRLKTDYADFAPELIGELEELRSKLTGLQADTSKQAEAEQARADLARKEDMARQETIVIRDHPDFGEIMSSKAFADWVMGQPRMVHEAIIRNGEGIVDAAEAGKVVSDFKRETGYGKDELAERRQRQLAANEQIPSRTGTQPGTVKRDDYDQEWDRLEAEDQREAKR